MKNFFNYKLLSHKDNTILENVMTSLFDYHILITFVQTDCRAKMRLYFLFLCCFYFNQTIYAQKLILSEKEDVNLRNDDFAVVGNVQNLLAVYKKSNGQVSIIFYDSVMIKRKEIAIPFIDNNFTNIYFSATKESLFAFYQLRENKKENIYATKLLNNDKWSEPFLVNSISSNGNRQRIEYKLSNSEDGNYHLVYAGYTSDNSYVVQAILLNNQFKEIFRINQLLPDNDLQIIDNAAVSNTGFTYLLATEKLSMKGMTEEAKLMVAAPNAFEFTFMPLALQKYAIGDIQFNIDNEHELCYVSSFYGESKFSNPSGVFFAPIKEGQMGAIESHFTPMSLSVSKGKNDLKDFKIRCVSLKEDAGIEIIAEKYFQNIRTISSASPTMMNGFIAAPDNTRTITEYYYAELVAINLNPDGSLVWSQTILKDQESNDDAGIYSSIGILEHKLGKAILFNDVNSKQARLMSAYLGSNAELAMKELQTSEDIDEWSWMPRSSKQISKSEIVMPCVMKNYLCFLKISF